MALWEVSHGAELYPMNGRGRVFGAGSPHTEPLPIRIPANASCRSILRSTE